MTDELTFRVSIQGHFKPSKFRNGKHPLEFAMLAIEQLCLGRAGTVIISNLPAQLGLLGANAFADAVGCTSSEVEL